MTGSPAPANLRDALLEDAIERVEPAPILVSIEFASSSADERLGRCFRRGEWGTMCSRPESVECLLLGVVRAKLALVSDEKVRDGGRPTRTSTLSPPLPLRWCCGRADIALSREEGDTSAALLSSVPWGIIIVLVVVFVLAVFVVAAVDVVMATMQTSKQKERVARSLLRSVMMWLLPACPRFN